MKTRTEIKRQEGVRGGAPTVAGTRITVTDIVRYYRMYLPELAKQFGEPPDIATGCVVPMAAIVKEIRGALPHLSDEQVYAAFVYWRDNQAEIEKELREEDAATRKLERLYSKLP